MVPFCLKEILKQNVDFDILDINIADNQGVPHCMGVILGIRKLIEERVDIINIGLGFVEYSEELYQICQLAINNNIAIISAASCSRNAYYPADFENVLSVQVHNDLESKEIKTIDNSTLSIYVKESIIQNKNSDVLSPYSTKTASAYFSGILGKKLDGICLYDKFTILQKNFGISLEKSKKIIEKTMYKTCKLYDELKDRKIAVVFLPYKKIENVNFSLKLQNIVAFYDHDLRDFYSFGNPCELESNFNTILVVNISQIKAKICDNINDRFKNCEIIFVGNFEYNIANEMLIHKYEDFFSEKFATLNKPVILISGLGSNLNKFDVQTNLIENLEKYNLKSKAVTYSPEGVLYGFDIFKYPQKIVFPDIVCSINNYMHCAETQTDLDVWVINVGGGCFFINNQNKNIFGKLVTAYLDACNVDIFILCINSFVDRNILKFYIFKLKNSGIREVFLVFYKNAFNIGSIETKDGLNVYEMDDKSYKKSLKHLKENINEKIFTLDDVKNNKLYSCIIKKFKH